jgi:hypothetical protein
MLQPINRPSDFMEAVIDKWIDSGYDAAATYLKSLFDNQFITLFGFNAGMKELKELEATPVISMDDLEKEMAWLLK